MSKPAPADADLPAPTASGGVPLLGSLLRPFSNLEMVRESETLLVTFGFRCNLACTFCMVEDVLDRYRGASLDDLRRFIADPVAMAHIRRITLSGGEATLEPDLLDYIRLARSAGVVHVRIQTNATRLHDRAYLRRLLDAGVDEFFVSLHGANAEVCDAITRKPGSFKAIVAGLRALQEAGARVVTNTAMCAQNYQQLPQLVELVAGLGVRELEFWNMWSRIDPQDTRQHLIPVAAVAPHLQAALRRALALQLRPAVKWFPSCMLGELDFLADNGQPTVLIEPEFWDTAPEYACQHASACAAARNGSCAGLSNHYVAKYGWELATLQPYPLDAADRAPRKALLAPDITFASLGLEPGQTVGGYTVQPATTAYGVESVSLLGPAGPLVLELHPPSHVPAYVTTEQFALSYKPLPADPSAKRVLEAVVARLLGRTAGSALRAPAATAP